MASVVSRMIAVSEQIHGLAPGSIRGSARPAYLVRARQRTVHAVRDIRPHLTLQHLGMEFCRDHSTLLNSISVINEALQSDPAEPAAYRALHDALQAVSLSAGGLVIGNSVEAVLDQLDAAIAHHTDQLTRLTRARETLQQQSEPPCPV